MPHKYLTEDGKGHTLRTWSCSTVFYGGWQVDAAELLEESDETLRKAHEIIKNFTADDHREIAKAMDITSRWYLEDVKSACGHVAWHVVFDIIKARTAKPQFQHVYLQGNFSDINLVCYILCKGVDAALFSDVE